MLDRTLRGAAERWGQTPADVATQGWAVTYADLDRLAFAGHRLARYKLPAPVVTTTALPLTAAEKLDRAALRRLVADELSPAPVLTRSTNQPCVGGRSRANQSGEELRGPA
jgi:acyl-CoA synthetase (AMP-forming)/AMP-acid ligase II